jgi:hypothetical protein
MVLYVEYLSTNQQPNAQRKHQKLKYHHLIG